MCVLAAVCTGAIRVVFIDETASAAEGALHKRSMAYSLHLFLVRPGARVAVGLVGRVCILCMYRLLRLGPASRGPRRPESRENAPETGINTDNTLTLNGGVALSLKRNCTRLVRTCASLHKSVIHTACDHTRFYILTPEYLVWCGASAHGNAHCPSSAPRALQAPGG